MHLLEKFKYCPVCGSHHFEVSGERSKKCDNCGFEYFMNPSAANVAFIVNGKGEILVERRKNEPAKGTLDLPGGFAEPGETAEEGVRREVHEETNLTVLEAEYLFYDVILFGNRYCRIFECLLKLRCYKEKLLCPFHILTLHRQLIQNFCVIYCCLRH